MAARPSANRNATVLNGGEIEQRNLNPTIEQLKAQIAQGFNLRIVYIRPDTYERLEQHGDYMVTIRWTTNDGTLRTHPREWQIQSMSAIVVVSLSGYHGRGLNNSGVWRDRPVLVKLDMFEGVPVEWLPLMNVIIEKAREEALDLEERVRAILTRRAMS